MASETDAFDQHQTSFRGIPIFVPFILGFNATNPPQATQPESRDRVIIINPVVQSMLIMEASGGLESLFRDLSSDKSCRRPASKASIDAMPSVEIVNGDDQCVVCLEEFEAGGSAKEMPCMHRFHEHCIEKWLKINGSCPVCRYEMPVDEDEDASRKTREENDGERRRGVWVSFDFGGGWRRWRDDQNSSNDRRENTDSLSNRQETESNEVWSLVYLYLFVKFPLYLHLHLQSLSYLQISGIKGIKASRIDFRTSK